MKLSLHLTAVLKAWDEGRISETTLNIWLARYYP